MSNGLKKKPAKKADDKIEEIEEKITKPIKRYIRFLKIDDERQKKIFEDINERSDPNFNFILLTVFSTIIVALGLIIDNAAVVIGGMIIAPLIWPILALGLAIIRGNMPMLKKATFTILKATLIIFLVSFVISVFSPYLGESSEVMLRVQPTLFELFIALAAGFIGTYVVAHPKLSGALAGVVAAVALVPPLSVMGILIANGSFILASGAALLYFTNLIAMTFAAIILFLLVGVKFPKRESSKNIAMSNISWFVIFLIIIAIPLTLVMRDIIKENGDRAVVRDVIEEYTMNAVITNLVVDDQRNLTIINATIQSPVELTSLYARRLSDILAEKLGTPVNLKVTVVPTYEVSQDNK